MNRSPSFQFYPGDWRKDPGVQALDYFDRGVWFEILCIMFESEQRGKLVLNGQKMPEEALARLLGLDNQKITTTITRLLQYGVAKVEPDTGIVYNKRMLEDERIRQIRRDCGSLGGNPSLKKGERNPYYPPILDNQKDNQKITPSSSSSSSIKKKCVAPPPDVKAAVDYFSQTTEAAKGFKPKFAAKDVAAVKRCLKTQSLDDIKAQIDFFLSIDKSKDHPGLAAALSADTYNLFMAKKAEAVDPLGGFVD